MLMPIQDSNENHHHLAHVPLLNLDKLKHLKIVLIKRIMMPFIVCLELYLLQIRNLQQAKITALLFLYFLQIHFANQLRHEL